MWVPKRLDVYISFILNRLAPDFGNILRSHHKAFGLGGVDYKGHRVIRVIYGLVNHLVVAERYTFRAAPAGDRYRSHCKFSLITT